MPKAGTHLLTEVLVRSGYRWSGVHVDSNALRGGRAPDWIIDAPVRQSVLDGLPARRGQFTTAHVPWDPELAACLPSSLRRIHITRDLRDVVVSYVHYVLRLRAHPMHADFSRMASQERLAAAISGYTSGNGAVRPAIAAARDGFAGWEADPDTMTVSFERLSGSAGEHDQLLEIARVLTWLGVPSSPHEARRVRNALRPASSVTFRSGTSGSWRAEFTDEVTRLFAESVPNSPEPPPFGAEGTS
jgi:hypothetical protein